MNVNVQDASAACQVPDVNGTLTSSTCVVLRREVLGLAEIVRETVDLRPSALIQRLDLLRPIYRPTAAYGHFGRDDVSWESLDLVDALQSAAGHLA